jgi:hypothetical protein
MWPLQEAMPRSPSSHYKRRISGPYIVIIRVSLRRPYIAIVTGNAEALSIHYKRHVEVPI